jgi:hypothetical protein
MIWNVDDVNDFKMVTMDCCCTAWRSGCASCSPTSVSASSSSSSAGVYSMNYFSSTMKNSSKLMFLLRFSPYEWQIEESMAGTTVSNHFSVINSLWFALGKDTLLTLDHFNCTKRNSKHITLEALILTFFLGPSAPSKYPEMTYKKKKETIVYVVIIKYLFGGNSCRRGYTL